MGQSGAGLGAWVVLAGRCGWPRWVELRFCSRILKFFVELRGAGLAAVAVNAVALIWELARMDFFDHTGSVKFRRLRQICFGPNTPVSFSSQGVA